MKQRPLASADDASRMNRRRWLAFGALAFGMGGFGAWVVSRRLMLGNADEQALDLLYGMTLPDALGQPVALAPLRGRALVLNFWATWCPPCIEEMPELNAIALDFRGHGLQVAGIGVDSAANIRQFWDKQPMQYPLLVGGTQSLELVRRFGNTSGALPFTVVVDAKGRIAWRTLGRFDTAALRAQVVRAL